MPKYTIEVEMTHTFESVENFEVEVEAQDKAEALILARNKAYDECGCDAYDAELALAIKELQEREEKLVSTLRLYADRENYERQRYLLDPNTGEVEYRSAIGSPLWGKASDTLTELGLGE